MDDGTTGDGCGVTGTSGVWISGNSSGDASDRKRRRRCCTGRNTSLSSTAAGFRTEGGARWEDFEASVRGARRGLGVGDAVVEMVEAAVNGATEPTTRAQD